MQLVQLQAAIQQSIAARVDSYRVPKIPPFLIKDPMICSFKSRPRSRPHESRTKRAHYVIMSLDAEAIACCRDLIAEPDVNEPYTKLKQRIIENFSSAESQLRQMWE